MEVGKGEERRNWFPRALKSKDPDSDVYRVVVSIFVGM